MKKPISILVAALILTAGSGAALAGQGGAGKAAAPAGGSSAPHMSEKGLANTNAPGTANRSTGLDRAEDRMSESGLSHSKGDEARLEPKPDGGPGKGKGKP